MSKVSIIVPVYKVEKYLKKCVNSILAQTFTDFELILVDDGSPDDCPKICDEYTQKDERIRVIHKENGGLSSARNAGLEIATGEFVYFCDSDDYISLELLEKCLARLEEDGSDAVRFGYYKTKDGEVLEVRYGKFNSSVECLETAEEKIKYIKKSLFEKTLWHSWACIYRLEVIRKNGLFFEDNKEIYAEDMYFSILFAFYASKISLLGEQLYYYNLRDDSITGDVKNKVKLNEINELSCHLYSSIKDEQLKEEYDDIHHLIVNNQIVRLPKIRKLKDIKVYDVYLNSIVQKEFFTEQNRKYYYKNRKRIRKENGGINGWYENIINRYIFDENKFIFTVNYACYKVAHFIYGVFAKIYHKIKKGN